MTRSNRQMVPDLSYMKTWPEEYTRPERLLEIELPWGGIKARIWFDAASTEWDEQKLVSLGRNIRRNSHWQGVEPRVFLDWLATIPAVTAVEVVRTLDGVSVGVSFRSVWAILPDRTTPDITSVVLGPGSSREPDLRELRKITDRLSTAQSPSTFDIATRRQGGGGGGEGR